MNFNLWKHHGLPLDIIENMMPFERDIYILLLKQWLEEETKRREREKMAHG
jgi:hypothetical protein